MVHGSKVIEIAIYFVFSLGLLIACNFLLFFFSFYTFLFILIC